jgi:hypothetical protein
MKQVKIDIFNALKASVALNAIVASDAKGIKQIFSAWPPSNTLYPRVGFYRVAGGRGTSEDGKMSDKVNELYSVDCFAKTMTETEDMETAIDAAMDTLSWGVTAEYGPDIFEEEEKVYHKVLRYRIKSTTGE